MRPLVVSSAHFPPVTDPEEAKRSLGLVHRLGPPGGSTNVPRFVACYFDR